MLRWLTKGIIARVGTLLAVLALGAFVTPPMAVAFAPTPAAIHCLLQAGAEVSRHHEPMPNGISHRSDADHGKHSGGRAHEKSACCGMFSFTGLVSDAAMVLLNWSDSVVPAIAEAKFNAIDPEQPTKPPISSPSL